MKELLSCLLDIISNLKDYFKEYITNKPFVSVLFPVSGYGASYIPDGLLDITAANLVKASPLLNFIDQATPYLRFVFLILTVTLSILSVVLQIKKLRKTE